MDWIAASCLLVISSLGLYLTLRSIERYKTPIKIKSIAMFAAPIIPLLFYNLYIGASLKVPFFDVVILFFTAVFFSWFANIASLKALENAPNPGYPLIIGKSYVIYTTLVSIFLLWWEFSLSKIILIFAIILFSVLILFDPKKEKLQSKKWYWILPTIYTFFAWWNLALILTYLSQKGISASVLNLYLLSFVTLFIMCEILFKKQKYSLKSRNELLHIVAIGVFFTIFQQSTVYGYIVAPNPGYINAMNVWSIGLVTLCSYFLFWDTLNLKKIIGVFGIIFCLILLVL